MKTEASQLGRSTRSAAIACLAVGCLGVAGWLVVATGLVVDDPRPSEVVLDVASTLALLVGGFGLFQSKRAFFGLALVGGLLILLYAWLPLHQAPNEYEFEASLAVGLLGSTLSWFLLRAWHEVSQHQRILFWAFQLSRTLVALHALIFSLTFLGGFVTITAALAWLLARRTAYRISRKLEPGQRSHALSFTF